MGPEERLLKALEDVQDCASFVIEVAEGKGLADYRVAPVSAITHVAPVQSIESWKNTNKYVVDFAEPIEELKKPIKLVPKGKIKAPQAPRYTSYERLMAARTLDEAF